MAGYVFGDIRQTAEEILPLAVSALGAFPSSRPYPDSPDVFVELVNYI